MKLCASKKPRLILGDCMEELKSIPDNSIDMVLCDLPYGITKNEWDVEIPMCDHVYDGKRIIYLNDFLIICYRKGVSYKDALKEWGKIKRPGLWSLYDRVVKENGAVCLFADGSFMARLMMSNQKMWRYNIVWDKVIPSGFLNSHRMPLRRTEEICVFYKKPPVYNPQMTVGNKNHSKGNKDGYANNNYGEFKHVDNADKLGNMKFPTSLLSISKSHPSVMVHPTEKPVEVCEWLIRTYTNEGDTVLDNCMGSGSTGKACENLGRRFIGIEANEDLFKVAERRMSR